MKNVGLYIGMVSFLMMVSCDKKSEKTTETIETNTVQKETVIIKDTVKEPDGTSIKISNDGIDVDSKEVKVEVKK
jgi:hypothetical protein